MYTVFVSVLIAAAFLALWLGVWLSISYLAGMASGWRKLAALYPDTTPNQHGEMKKWVYIRFGATRYNGAIVFEALPIGLRIRTLWFFRFGQPPLRRYFLRWPQSGRNSNPYPLRDTSSRFCPF
jgi:hypothetical protein